MDENEMKLMAWYNAIAIENIFSSKPKSFDELFGVSPCVKIETNEKQLDIPKLAEQMRSVMNKQLMKARIRRD